MKTKVLFLLLCILAALTVKAEDNSIYCLADGHDYYIYNTYYNRVLAPSADNSQPRLVAYDQARDEQFLFTAVKAPTAGYFMLRHKATGRYMTASTQNSYSVQLSTATGTGNAYQWSVCPSREGRLVSLRNKDAALGVDTAETVEYIGVWYDKVQGESTTFFQVFEANGQGMESSRKAWATKELANVTDYIEQELENTKYPLLYRTRLPKSLEVARAWIADPEGKTVDQLFDKSAALRDSLATMTSYEASVMLTETEMSSFGSSFSLALSELTMAPAFVGDSLYVLIRNAEGRGARCTLHESGNYIFVYNDAQLQVYKDGMLASTLPTYYIPKLTPQGTEAEWTIIRKSRVTSCLPELLSETKVVTQGGGITVNKYGNRQRTVISLSNTTLDLEGQIDFHIISETAPLTKCKLNLVDNQSWVIFDNTRPSEVVNQYLSQIKIKGETAQVNKNCRVVIYLNGALVMPYSTSAPVLTGYDGEQYTGDEITYRVGAYTALGKNANRLRSFRLKRGYMAVLASGKKGSGYSRVYVADHADLEVPVLPKALYGRISSITVKKWQYVSKKGWCSETSNSAIATECRKVRATWFYTWSADRSSTYDTEYIPIRQHLYWPSMSQVGDHFDATACLSVNEPEHSEQHTSDKCSCGGTISPWSACTITPDFQDTGMRIGSPAPTDASWLTEYIQNCNNMAYRCDFVAFHAYWGTNEAANARAWYNQLKSIYQNTKRPIWITEWNNGASWTTESWPSDYSDKLEKQRKAIKEIQQMLDTCSFVERYAVYNWDTYYRAMINWDDGSLLPAGKVYRDAKSDFAYNAKVQFTPVWWEPSLKTPTLNLRINDADQTLVATVKNDNGDVTDQMTIQYLDPASGQWQEYYTETDRSRFDDATNTYRFPLSDFDLQTAQLRVYVRRTIGGETYSPVATTGYVQNPGIYAESKTEVSGWQCQRSAANGFTKATGDTYFEVWDKTAAGMQFDYWQEIEDLPQGVYELSAAVFNTADGVAGDQVNGSVVLYAQSDTVQYFAPVIVDSPIDYERRLTVPGIVVMDGRMRIGIKNIGQMGARWAGADDFKLIRTGDLDADSHRQYMEARAKAEEDIRSHFFRGGTDASAFVVNPSCQRRDTYGWTVENNGINSGESSDGQSDNAYWNLWRGSAFTSTMTQDITYLPEGQYSATALLRGNAEAAISLAATVVGPHAGDAEEQATTITPIGQTGGEIGNGWIQAQTPYVTVRPGDTLRVTMRASITGASGWWSADDFGLQWQYVAPLPDGLKAVTPEAPRTERIYDLSGRPVARPARGIYIRGGKKILR